MCCTHHLTSGHTDSLNRKLATAHIKQILQTGTEKVDHENVMKTLLAEVVYLGYPGWRGQGGLSEERDRVGEKGLTTSS